MPTETVNNETKSKEQLIRELKVARAQLALEIERKIAQIENADKLIVNLKSELNIMAHKVKAEVNKRKELNRSLEASISKQKKLSQSIEDLSSDSNILKKIKNEFEWFREINLLRPDFAG